MRETHRTSHATIAHGVEEEFTERRLDPLAITLANKRFALRRRLVLDDQRGRSGGAERNQPLKYLFEVKAQRRQGKTPLRKVGGVEQHTHLVVEPLNLKQHFIEIGNIPGSVALGVAAADEHL